jgi:D-alanyl-lipoteichoic acid acyltransferase DltB (MBOAT superfamily)
MHKNPHDYFNPLKHNGNYMPHLVQQSTTLHFVFMGFRMILNANRDYFFKQHQPVDLCNGEVWCFLCGTD